MKTPKLTLLIVLCSALFLGSCKKKPVASFTVSDETPVINQFLIFTNTSVDGHSYAWDFGDGGTSTQKNPTYHYTTAGTYEVTLKVYSKKEKKVDEYSKTISINVSTKDRLVDVWNYDWLRSKSYQNDMLTSDETISLEDLYDIHTIEFKENNTYLTNLDGDNSSGIWSVVVEDVSIDIDGDVAQILNLSDTEFNFFSRNESEFGGITYVDSLWGYMSR